MPITNRLFTYSSTPIAGASQSGNLAISTTYIPGYTWWGGPDENVGYVIAHTDTNIGNRTERNKGATISTNTVGFWRTATQSDASFLSLFNSLFNQNYVTASTAASWLNNNGYWTSYTPGAVVDLIRSALSTNVSAYDAASVGNFIKVTAAEYANVASTVAGVTKYVMNDTDLTSTFSGWSTNYSVSYNDTVNSIGAIPANNYIIGYAYSGNSAAAVTTYLRTGTTVNGTHTKIGSNVVFTDTGAKTVYFIRKAPSTATATKVYLSFYTNGTALGQVSGKTNYPIYYSSGIDTNTWSLFTGAYPTFQALATTAKSW